MVLHIGRLCSLIIVSFILSLPAAATDNPDVDIQVQLRPIKGVINYLIQITNVGSTNKVEVKNIVVNERGDCRITSISGNTLLLGDTHKAFSSCNPIRVTVETSNGTYRAAFKP